MSRTLRFAWLDAPRCGVVARSRRSGNRGALGRTLRIESLEERRLLSITVNTLIDENDGVASGGVSLRDAIAAAPAGETIDFAPQLTSAGPATILLKHGALTIARDLTINGLGAGLLTIDASGNDPTPGAKEGNGSRVFNISDANSSVKTVAISDLTLTGGDSLAAGGAIFARENLTVARCVITGNATLTASILGGGGIYSSGTVGVPNTLTLIDTAVTNNQAVSDEGGGIRKRGGSLIMQGCTVSGNTSLTTGGGLSAADGNVQVQIESSTFSDNTGAIYSGGGGIFIFDGTLTLADSTLSGNTARAGGGLYLTSESQGTVTRCTISDNYGYYGGGGIWLNGGALDVSNSQISGNHSISNGGGVYAEFGGAVSLSGVDVHDNVAYGNGGGVYNTGGLGTLTIAGSAIVNNSASSGGGIYSPHALVLSQSTVGGNSAYEVGGGVVASSATITDSLINGNTAGQGGGLFSKDGDVSIVNSTISGNTAATSGGGLYLIGPPSAQFEVAHSTIAFNSAASFGGGVFFAGPVLSLDHSIVADNSSPTTKIGPDIAALAGGGVDARYSLIGNNANSGLVSTPTGMADANGNLIGPVTSAEPFTVSVDMAAMGNFEGGPNGDSFVFEYSIDGGPYQPLFTSSVSENGNASYVLSGGAQFIIDDPLLMNGRLLTNKFRTLTAVIPVVAGAQIQIRFSASDQGPGEAVAWRNLVVAGQLTGKVAGTAVSTAPLTDQFAAYTADPDSTMAGHMFGIRSRLNPGTPGLPLDIVDDSVSISPADVLGIVTESDMARFFGVVDNTSGVGAAKETATWTFNVPLVPLDPLLGPLADNGGSTMTHALLPGSPAIDAGDPTAMAGVGSTPTTDQRGMAFTRIYNGSGEAGARIDIGAFELQPPGIAADFDGDSEVGGADFLAWQRGLGSAGALATKSQGNADGDGDVDAADLGAWKSAFGAAGDGAAVEAVAASVSSQQSGTGQYAQYGNPRAATRLSPQLTPEMVDAAMAMDQLLAASAPPRSTRHTLLRGR